MRQNHDTVRRGLKAGEYEWGYAVRNPKTNTYSYFINAVAFAKKECVEIPQEMIW
jgi:hypothetical protein